MSATLDIAKGSPLPDDHHVLRYVGGGLVDRESNRIHGSAFLPRKGENEPSVSWREFYPSPVDNQIRNIARNKRLKWGRTAKLVQLSVRKTARLVDDASHEAIQLSVIYDPLPADEAVGYGADAAMLAIGYRIRDSCIAAMFDASAYAS